MELSRDFYRRNLPHYQPSGYTFFITFRLYGTLPIEVVENFRAIKKQKLTLIAGYDNLKVRNEKYEEFRYEYFKLFDDYMDRCTSGVQWLKQKEVAEVVIKTLHSKDGKEYDLISYTIMPNHLHIVFIPDIEPDLFRSSNKCKSDINIALHYPVTDILRKLKGSSARECNKVLGRTGAFWQHESYDHVIRDSDELKRIVNYVIENPVKAGLTATPEEWAYNYVNYDLIPVV